MDRASLLLSTISGARMFTTNGKVWMLPSVDYYEVRERCVQGMPPLVVASVLFVNIFVLLL